MLLCVLSTWLEKPRKINHYTRGWVTWIWCFLSLHVWSCSTLPLSLILYIRHCIIQDLDILPTTLAVLQHWRFLIFILVCLALKHTCSEFLVSSPQSFLAFKKKTLDIPLLLRKKRQKNYFFIKKQMHSLNTTCWTLLAWWIKHA